MKLLFYGVFFVYCLWGLFCIYVSRVCIYVCMHMCVYAIKYLIYRLVPPPDSHMHHIEFPPKILPQLLFLIAGINEAAFYRNVSGG